jgi:predicted nucleic acid-binding protein
VKYLLDTCVFSEFVKPRPNSNLVQWMSEQNDFDLAVSALTMGELRLGMAILPEGKRRTILELWLLEELADKYGDRVLPVTGVIGMRWGALSAERRKKGRPLPPIDGLILATASIHELAIVTRNVADFRHFDVEVINPWTL